MAAREANGVRRQKETTFSTLTAWSAEPGSGGGAPSNRRRGMAARLSHLQRAEASH